MTESVAFDFDTKAHLDTLHRLSLELVRERDLETVLRRIAQAALELLHARYAAIGIPDGSGGLERFVTAGMSPEEVKRIPHPPEGRGLIGLLLKERRPLRLDDIAGHPRSVGFPAHHPLMRTFLGVPIVSMGAGIGQIYVTEKLGGQAFNSEDEKLGEMLAAYAAVAIDNARHYIQLQTQERELERSNEDLTILNEVASAASTTLELNGMLDKAVEVIARHLRAQSSEVFLDEDRNGEFTLMLRRGDRPSSIWKIDRFPIGAGVLGRVAARRELIITNKAQSESAGLTADLADDRCQSVICLPLVSKDLVLGVLTLATDERWDFESRQRQLFTGLGLTLGEAVENALLLRKSQRLAVLEERERIGMDLHDGIIQSIYAVGLTLEDGMLSLEESPGMARDRLEKAIGGLNSVIRDIRAYILDMKPQRIAYDNFSEGLRQLAREFRAQTLAHVDLHISEGAAIGLGQHSTNALYHIAQEALANVAKHARATRVRISFSRESEWFQLMVEDNGRGFSAEAQKRILGHGLPNIEERARASGGEATIVSEKGKGTRVQVRIPTRAQAPVD
jgi:two-component system, NarL family, sensor histidine kinase DevS